MADSKIEWTDATWNPVTGCDRVSPGCDNCYAATMAKRLKAMGQPRYQTDGDPRTSGPGFGVAVHDDVLGQPLRWRKPRRVFVNSMSDLFHPAVPNEFIARVFAVMAVTPRHTFQVLTKRPKRMRALLTSGVFASAVIDALPALADLPVPGRLPPEDYDAVWTRIADACVSVADPMPPLPNVWLGVSVEDQQRADERIPPLLDTPAAVRFLSMEPLLGTVDLSAWIKGSTCSRCAAVVLAPGGCSCGSRVLRSALHWVIVGGESGPGARPMHPQWARHLRDQCEAFGVPFFFKQWGAWAPESVLIDADYDDAYHFQGVDGDTLARPTGGKHATGRVLDGRTWDESPEAVTAHA